MSIDYGARYSIHPHQHDGGIMQFESGATGLLATLGVDSNDISQQWILHPTGEQWAYSIGNWEFGTYAAEGDSVILSSSEPRTWYIVPQGYGASRSICIDAVCSLVWAPLSQVYPARFESNNIVLVAPSGARYERWDFIAVGSATSRPARTTDASDRPVQTGPQALKSCTPCGSFQCTFTPAGDPTSSTYSVLIGQPVANCNSGSQEPATTKFGGTYELEQSFSIEVNSGAGLGFLGPSISTAVTTGNKTRIERAQEIEVTIRPGQIGALVANITYVTTPGRIRVDRSTLAFVSVQPDNVVGYSVVYTSCDSKFQALTLPKVECSGTSSGFGLISTAMIFQVSVCLAMLVLGIFTGLL